MMPAILDFVRVTRAALKVPAGRVLEIGSRNINGTVRSVFTDAQEYLGVDIEDGPDVDFRLDAEHLDAHYAAASFDSVLCFECLEHTVRPWLIVAQLKRALRPGGYLWVSTPTFGFPLHRFPVDCYRFGEDAYRLWLFADLELLALGTVVDELGQPAIVGAGRMPA